MRLSLIIVFVAFVAVEPLKHNHSFIHALMQDILVCK